MLHYYMPGLAVTNLDDHQWAEKFAQLQDIRTREAKAKGIQ